MRNLIRMKISLNFQVFIIALFYTKTIAQSFDLDYDSSYQLFVGEWQAIKLNSTNNTTESLLNRFHFKEPLFGHIKGVLVTNTTFLVNLYDQGFINDALQIIFTNNEVFVIT